jgi:tight adherence protein B
MRRRRFERQLPDAADALAAALRGGAGLSQAIALLAEHQRSPLRDELSLLQRQQRLGLPMDEALLQLAQRSGSRDVELFGATLRVARELGGGLADALQRLAAGLRRRRAIEDKIDALTSQGRTQGVIVSLLPMLLALALLAIEPDATRPLFTTPAGWATLGVVVALQIVGWMLIRRIVRIEV